MINFSFTANENKNLAAVAVIREIGSFGAHVAAGVAKKLRLGNVHSEIVASNLGRTPGVADGAMLPQSFSAARFRQVDYIPYSIFDPLFAGLSASAAGINAALAHHPYLRGRC